jgi:dihydroflavonol-4-reductase
MRALITGASGFIGAHLVRALAADGVEVVSFEHRPDPDAPPPPGVAEVVPGDVLEPRSLERAIASCDAVFHLAAVYSYARRDRALMAAVNVEGTRNVLRAAARGRRRRVVYTSSCATCGPVPGRAATERDHPPVAQLVIPYKRTKIAAEQLALRAAAEGLDVVVVNPTVPVGAGDLRPTPTGKMVADVAAGHGTAYLARSALNVVSVEDVAAGHARAFAHGRSGERYLLGGENLSIKQVFALIAASAERRPPRIAVPWHAAYLAALVTDGICRPLGKEPERLMLAEVRAGRLPHLFDDSKARVELGYSSRPAAEALANAVHGALAQAAGATNDSVKVRQPLPQ